MKNQIACTLILFAVFVGTGVDAKAGKVVSYETVPLNITIEPADSNGNQCAICSDETAVYLDGMAGISARLDSLGNMVLNLPSATNGRSVTFLFSQPPIVTFPGAQIPPSGPQDQVSMGTAHLDSNDKKPIQHMVPGSWQYMRLKWTFTLDDERRTQWHITFQRPDSDSAFVAVTRLDNDTWVIEPAPVDWTVLPGVARVIHTPGIGKFSVTEDGYYSMPFRVVARRQVDF